MNQYADEKVNCVRFLNNNVKCGFKNNAFVVFVIIRLLLVNNFSFAQFSPFCCLLLFC